MLFARWGSRILVSLLTRPGQVALDLSPDATVLAFTIAAGVVAGVVFGIAPAWRAVHVDLHVAMKPGSREPAARASWFRAGNALVVAQITLSLLLVVGSGLLLSSWRRLAAVDPGFRSEGLLLAEVNIRPAGVPSNQRNSTYVRIRERLLAIPGATLTGMAWRTPFSSNAAATIEVPASASSPAQTAVVRLNEVSDGYLNTIGARLLAGRDFNAADLPAAPRVAIISEELARKYFGGLQAVGRHFREQIGRELSPPVEVVGVVANTKESSLREEDRPILYFALSQRPVPASAYGFAVRTMGPSAALAPAVKAAIAEIDPRFSFSINTLQQRIGDSVRLPVHSACLPAFSELWPCCLPRLVFTA